MTAAMASYAKQSQDETLMNTAMRIRARATRRCGELLERFKEQKGGRPSEKPVGTPLPVSRAQAARDAGLSKDQQIAAIRVARVPAPEFEAAVESAKPPTVTELAEVSCVRAGRFLGRRGARVSVPHPTLGSFSASPGCTGQGLAAFGQG